LRWNWFQLWLYSFYRLYSAWQRVLNFSEASIQGPQGWDLLVNWIMDRIQVGQTNKQNSKLITNRWREFEIRLSKVSKKKIVSDRNSLKPRLYPTQSTTGRCWISKLQCNFNLNNLPRAHPKMTLKFWLWN